MFTVHIVLPLCFLFSFTNGETNFSESEIMEWKPPEYIKKEFPYYLSGYDYDGSPVFVLEAGKWNIRSAIERGPKTTADLQKHTTQMMLRWRVAGNETLGSPGAVVIADIEGLNLAQLGHFGIVRMVLKQFQRFQQITQLPGIKKIYGINVNYFFERVFQVGRPLLGEAANLIDLYGTNSAKWKPVLLKDIPAEELPAWYGGSKSHQPIQVFG